MGDDPTSKLPDNGGIKLWSNVVYFWFDTLRGFTLPVRFISGIIHYNDRVFIIDLMEIL